VLSSVDLGGKSIPTERTSPVDPDKLTFAFALLTGSEPAACFLELLIVLLEAVEEAGARVGTTRSERAPAMLVTKTTD